jgi:hypothetical protein
MFKAHGTLMLAAAVLVAAPACASRSPYYRYPSNVRVADDYAYRNGFEQGRRAGEEDARRNRSFDYGRHNEYRDADRGYRRNGDRDEYRLEYRRGFQQGYDEAYRRYARNGRYGDPRVNPQINRGPFPGGGVAVPRSPAADIGFRDGYDQGRSDARDRHRFDPVRASRYRSGDHDYNNRYGSRDEYKREYRAAFEQGYERGYRENQRR